MVYISYNEYKEIGGVLDETAFERNIYRACGIIDAATSGRVKAMSAVPSEVKALCRDLAEICENERTAGIAQSRSQTAGAVSESVSYFSSAEHSEKIKTLISDYLSEVCDDNGTPLLYRGCMR